MSTYIIQDLHAGRNTDSTERILLKAAAIANIVRHIERTIQDGKEQIHIVFNGDICHAAKATEFDATIAMLELQPLIDACMYYNIPITPVLGNWDIPRTHAAAEQWKQFLLNSIDAVSGNTISQLNIQEPQVFATVNGYIFTHGHLSQPSMSTVLTSLVLPILTRYTTIPNALSVLRNNTSSAIYHFMQSDESTHKKADAILAIQEWICRNPLIGALGKSIRSALDTALACSSASIAAKQCVSEKPDTIFTGHTHSVYTNSAVVNVGTTGADMRSIATFGVIDFLGHSTVMSAWHPAYQLSVHPYNIVQNIPVPKKYLDRSYVLS